MTRYGRKTLLFAASLSGLAGFTDAVGFMGSGGFFVSFMSGNSTRLGVGVSEGDLRLAGTAAGLLLCFLVGVVTGSLFRSHHQRPQSRLLLGIALVFVVAALVFPQIQLLGLGLLAFAMGTLNTVLEAKDEEVFGVTYMTGTLVRLGSKLADCFHGGFNWKWAPYALLWAGLSVGACLGAIAYRGLGMGSLWIAVGLSLFNAVLSDWYGK